MGDHSLFRDFAECRAKLHNAVPGDGMWFRGRLSVYAGLGGRQVEDTYLLGHRWKSWCCHCGAPIQTVFTSLKGFEATSPIQPLKHGKRPDEPSFNVPQRCAPCRQEGHQGTTPTGFTRDARAALGERYPRELVWWMHQREKHYRFALLDPVWVGMLLDAHDWVMHERHKILVDKAGASQAS